MSHNLRILLNLPTGLTALAVQSADAARPDRPGSRAARPTARRSFQLFAGNPTAGLFRNTVGVRLMPREDYWYVAELVSHLLSTARITGDISYAKLSICPGAVINGALSELAEGEKGVKIRKHKEHYAR